MSTTRDLLILLTYYVLYILTSKLETDQVDARGRGEGGGGGAAGGGAPLRGQDLEKNRPGETSG
jgi:hypothetical protein